VGQQQGINAARKASEKKIEGFPEALRLLLPVYGRLSALAVKSARACPRHARLTVSR
jgi:hypothetical protein